MDPNEQPSWTGDAPDKEKMEQVCSGRRLPLSMIVCSYMTPDSS